MPGPQPHQVEIDCTPAFRMERTLAPPPPIPSVSSAFSTAPNSRNSPVSLVSNDEVARAVNALLGDNEEVRSGNLPPTPRAAPSPSVVEVNSAGETSSSDDGSEGSEDEDGDALLSSLETCNKVFTVRRKRRGLWGQAPLLFQYHPRLFRLYRQSAVKLTTWLRRNMGVDSATAASIVRSIESTCLSRCTSRIPRTGILKIDDVSYSIFSQDIIE